MDYEQLVMKCTEYMEEKGLSQVKLAQKIGIAESTFSRWIKGKYPNHVSITEKVNLFFDKEGQREEVTTINHIPFANTSVSARIISVLEYCRIQKIIGTVYGDAGVGKTYTTKEWARDKTDVIIVTANPTFSSPKSFLKLLARRLKTVRVGSVDDIYTDIIDRLDGADMTIVVDEAQHLNMKTLEIIRSINDETGTAIVLIGNEAIYNRLLGKQQAEFAQMFSRLGMRSPVLTDMFSMEDIRNVFGVDEEDSAKYLLSICKSKYGLRGAVHVFTNARNNEDISSKGIRAMATLMGIAV